MGCPVATLADWQSLATGLQDKVTERLKTPNGLGYSGTSRYCVSAEPAGGRSGNNGTDAGCNSNAQWLAGGEAEARLYYLTNTSKTLEPNINMDTNWDKIGASIRISLGSEFYFYEKVRSPLR